MKKFLLLALLAITSITCKKEDQQDEPVIENAIITLITTNAVPGQMVLAEATTNLSINETARITVGDSSVRIFVYDGKNLSFVMPVMPEGVVIVDFTTLGTESKGDLTVMPFQDITDPDAIIQLFNDQMDQILINFNAFTNSPVINLDPKEIEYISSLRVSFMDEVDQMTQPEKKELAYYLRSQMPNATNFKMDSLNPDFYAGKYEGDPGDRLMVSAGNFITSMAIGVPTMMLAVNLLSVPSPDFITKGVGLAALLTSTTYLTLAGTYAVEIGNLKGLSFEISDAALKKAGVLSFKHGQEAEITVTGRFRNLIQSDNTSSIPIIKKTFVAMEQLQYWVNKSAEIVARIKSILPGNTTNPRPAFINPIKTNYTYSELPLAGKYLTLKQPSNTNIQLTSKQNLSSLTVKASSATLTDETPFTFEVNYTDPVFGSVLSKQVDALLLGKSYWPMDDQNAILTAITPFTSDVARTFFLSENMINKAPGIDYTKIQIKNNSNPNVSYTLNTSGPGFQLTFITSVHTVQQSSFEIHYQGKKVFTTLAEVSNVLGDYILELTSQNPGYPVVKSLNPGDAVTVPNGLIETFRLKYKGQYVKINPFTLDATSHSFTSWSLQAQDQHVGNYTISITDATNQRTILFPVDLTLSNEMYRAVVGNTFSIKQPGAGYSLELTFNANGTYTGKYSDGSIAPGGYYAMNHGHSHASIYQPCQNMTIDKRIIGYIHLPSGSLLPPNYIMFYEDGTKSANSIYACPESPYYVEIQ